jgi:hypothetical protein
MGRDPPCAEFIYEMDDTNGVLFGQYTRTPLAKKVKIEESVFDSTWFASAIMNLNLYF